MKMPKNRVLRRVFGLEEQEITGGGRKLQNKQVYSEPAFFYEYYLGN
jgi:hypothetical protein